MSLMLIALVGGGWSAWPLGRTSVVGILAWLLFLILGWAQFGPPIR